MGDIEKQVRDRLALSYGELTGQILKIIQKALAGEREACACLAAEVGGGGDLGYTIAKAIRERK